MNRECEPIMTVTTVASRPAPRQRAKDSQAHRLPAATDARRTSGHRAAAAHYQWLHRGRASQSGRCHNAQALTNDHWCMHNSLHCSRMTRPTISVVVLHQAGHGAVGITLAPITGLAIAELIADGVCTCCDLRSFGPDRFGKGSGTSDEAGGVGAARVGTRPVDTFARPQKPRL